MGLILHRPWHRKSQICLQKANLISNLSTKCKSNHINIYNYFLCIILTDRISLVCQNRSTIFHDIMQPYMKNKMCRISNMTKSAHFTPIFLTKSLHTSINLIQ